MGFNGGLPHGRHFDERRRPASLYPQHLATLQARADEALARNGHDHLLVPSGRRHYQVFDDRDYPFAVNPHFKHWLPLTTVADSWLAYTPGQRPKVIYLQPFDYWHVVPQAQGLVGRACGRARDPHPGGGAGTAARSGRARDPGAGANSALGDYVPNNPAAALDYLHYQRSYKTPYELALMRLAQRGARVRTGPPNAPSAPAPASSISTSPTARRCARTRPRC